VNGASAAAAAGKVNASNLVNDASGYSAMWIDLDIACGQCHGGGVSSAEISTTGSITAGGDATNGIYPITVADATGFASGKEVKIAGAGYGGADFKTIIAKVTGNTVYLTYPAITTVTNAAVTVAGNPGDGSTHYFSKTALAVRAAGMHNNTGAPTTDCATCHVTSQNNKVAIKGGFGAGKNHHGAVPGETAECTECHTRPGTLPTGWDTGTAFCLTCHQNYPTPNALVPGVTHHGGKGETCVSCHTPNDTTGATTGVSGPGILPVVVNCTTCHGTKPLNHPKTTAANAALGTGTAACQKCHDSTGNYAGIKPTNIDSACGQCHGGSSPTTAFGAPYLSLAVLTNLKTGMHAASVNSSPTSTSALPTVGHTAPVVTSWSVSFTDTTTDPDGTKDVVTVNWGDGSAISTGVAGDTFTHNYQSAVDSLGNPITPRARFYTIYQRAIDPINPRSVSKTTTSSFRVFVPERLQLVTSVTDTTGNAINGVRISIKKDGHTVKSALATGNTATFTNLLPGSYSIKAYKFRAISKETSAFDLSVSTSKTVSPLTP
jgi:hypothetical protein